MQPVIGITTYGRAEHELKSTHYDALTYLPTDYADSVVRAGGIAVHLPPTPNLFPHVLDRLDGIIFTGGTDVDPALYGGKRDHSELGRLDAERDRAEMDGVRAALVRKDLPILCICRGLQVLNVVCGGSLTEHIPDLAIGDMHRDDRGHWTLHDVSIVEGTKTRAALGTEKVRTTSGHHQAIRDLGAGLTVSAWAADGLIEAVEFSDHPWCVGVQWHPEITSADDPSQQRLFDTLVARGKAFSAETAAGK